MKKLFILSLAFFSFIAYLEAQELQWGTSYKKLTKSSIQELIAKDALGIYAYRLEYYNQSTRIPILEHYDNDLNFKYSKPLNFFTAKNIQFRDFIYLNNRLYLSFSEFDRKADRHDFYLQEVDKLSGSLQGDRQKVGETYSKVRTIRGAMVQAISPDSSKLVVASRKDIPALGISSAFKNVYRPDISNRFNLSILDKSLNSLWEKEIFLSYDERLFEAVSLKVDKHGDVYLLCKIYKDKNRNIRKGNVNYQYKLIAFRDQGETQQEYGISVGDGFINEIDFRIGKDGTIVCAGLYSKLSGRSVNGSFFMKIDRNSKEIVSEGKKAFEENFLQLFMNERRAKKGQHLYNYNISDIILRSDGGALIITEQYYVTERTITTTDALGRTQRETEYYYNFNDIIIINVNPDASVAWTSKIPKKQVSNTTRYSSFAQAIFKDKIYFLFNDYISKRSTVMLASVDTKGKVNFKELFNNKEVGTVTRPMVCKQTSKNTMIIFGEKRRNFRFGKLIFE